jgi:hypothetical protein
MRQFLLLLIAVCGLASLATAQDAAGTWHASIDTPNGVEQNTFVLKVDGGAVTGTVTGGMLGEQPITTGKIDGDKITFAINSDFGVITYSGKIQGDEMKLTLSAGDGQFTVDLTATRQK